MHPRRRRALLLLFVPSLAATTAHAAELLPVLAGRVDLVVASGDGLAVRRDGQALQLDRAGHVVGRCAGATAATGPARRRDGTTIPSERLLREAGFSEEDASPEAEALLDDEGAGLLAAPAERHRAGRAARASLAGTSDGAWLGTTDGLWRLEARTGACARASLGGREVGLVAAAAGSIVALSKGTLWRSSDEGASFAVAAGLAAPARALALTADGATAFVATDDGIVAVTAPRALRRVLERPADALVTCGSGVFALAADGVYRLDGIAVERLGDRPPTRALACASADGLRLVAAGVGLWSTDGGRGWREEELGLGHSFAGVAFASGRVWLAADDGLYASAAPDEAIDTPPGDSTAGVLPAALPASRPRAAGPPPPWAWLLPSVALSLDGWTESRARAGWRLWILVTVTLGRRGGGRPHETSEVP